jgi:hypothetical protein
VADGYGFIEILLAADYSTQSAPLIRQRQLCVLRCVGTRLSAFLSRFKLIVPIRVRSFICVKESAFLMSFYDHLYKV